MGVFVGGGYRKQAVSGIVFDDGKRGADVESFRARLKHQPHELVQIGRRRRFALQVIEHVELGVAPLERRLRGAQRRILGDHIQIMAVLRKRHADLRANRLEHVFVDMAEICPVALVDHLDDPDQSAAEVENRRRQARSRSEPVALVERIVEQRRLISIFDVDPPPRLGAMPGYALPELHRYRLAAVGDNRFEARRPAAVFGQKDRRPLGAHDLARLVADERYDRAEIVFRTDGRRYLAERLELLDCPQSHIVNQNFRISGVFRVFAKHLFASDRSQPFSLQNYRSFRHFSKSESKTLFI